jgi:uncharacterized protein YfaS (alpha-2-macroglobulin family)
MQRFNRATVALAAILATTAVMACGGDDSPNLVTGPTLEPAPAMSPATIIVTGNAQTVARNQTSAPLVVRAINANGGPIANAQVMWTIANGGTLSSTSTTTNANGETQVTVATGNTAIAYTITATAASTSTATLFMYVP